MDDNAVIPAQTVDAARLVTAVNDFNRALGCSITMRLLTGERGLDEPDTERLKTVLGDAGPQLVDSFRNAKEALTRAMLERCSVTRQAMHEQLQVLLACGAVSTGDDWYTMTDVDIKIGKVRAKVDRIDSARIEADGSIWGFLHVSPQERCGETWEFTWRDGQLKVRSRD